MKRKLLALVLPVMVSCILSVNPITIQAKSDKTDKKIDKMSDNEWLERTKVLDEGMRAHGNDPEKLSNWLAEQGVEKLTTTSVQTDGELVQPLSTGGNVNLRIPDVYQDRWSGRYIVSGYWEWSSLSNIDSSSGAPELISLLLAKTDYSPTTGTIFSSNPGGIAVYDNKDKLIPEIGWVQAIDISGIVFAFQDTWDLFGNAYVGYKGSVWMYLDTPPSEQTVYARMNMLHTWTSATLSDAGIQWSPGVKPTITATWSKTPLGWQTQNQITVYSWPRI